MVWLTLDAAAEQGPGRRAWQLRVASGDWPSYLDPAGVRMVWVGPVPDPVASTLDGLREEVRELRGLLLARTTEREAPRVTRPSPRASEGSAGGRPEAPPAASHETPREAPSTTLLGADGWRADLEALLVTHGGPKAVAAVLELGAAGRVTVARWKSGVRAPGPEMQARITSALEATRARAA